MNGNNESTASKMNFIDSVMDTNDSTLSTVLVQLGYNVVASHVNIPPFARVGLKYFHAESSNKSHNYIVGFLFDSQNAGKLVRMTSSDISEVASFILSDLVPKSESTIILVGKKGSRKDNRFTFPCGPCESHNLAIREFTSQDSIQPYISSILSDVDKIESRYVTKRSCLVNLA